MAAEVAKLRRRGTPAEAFNASKKESPPVRGTCMKAMSAARCALEKFAPLTLAWA